jgi:hypothetical protein
MSPIRRIAPPNEAIVAQAMAPAGDVTTSGSIHVASTTPIADTDPLGRSDACGLKRLLDRAFAQPFQFGFESKPEGGVELRQRLGGAVGKLYQSKLLRRAAKSALALAMLALLGGEPANRILETSSVEAVVNSQLIIPRSPIDGEISFTGAMSAGNAPLVAGTQLIHVRDRRADRSRLGDFKRELRRRKETQATITSRLTIQEQ